MKKSFKKKKQQPAPQEIQEINLVDIYGKLQQDLETINDPDLESTIISKLEEMLPDHSSILISFLRFYLKLIGLEFCAKWLNKMTLENINIKDLIEKQEQLQKENQQNFIDEQQCLQIEKDSSMVKFFEALFSSQTNLAFECELFFQFNFTWLTALTQIQYRNCRLAAVEIVRVVVNSLLQYAENLGNVYEYLEQSQQKVIIKFLNNIYQYLATNRVQDIQSQIKKKVISIIFTGFLCNHIPREAFHNSVGTILTSDNHESRELALIELELITKSLVESKKSLDRIAEFLNQQQVSLISLIFDQNESIQIRLIQFLKLLAKLNVVKYGFFNDATCQAFIRILFINNPRVRYESTSALFIFSKQISCLEDLIKFFFLHAPFQAITFKDCFSYMTSFVDSHPFVTDPETYAPLFENQEKQDKQEYQIMGLYFYASMLNFQKKKSKFWWINESSINTQDDFTHYFTTVSQIRLDLLEENSMLAYLYLTSNLNFTILKQSQLTQILDSAKEIIQKTFKYEILNQTFKIIRKCQEQMLELQIIKQHVSQITKYLQSQYQNQITNNMVSKLTCAFKHNILMGWKRILSPFDKILDYKGENSCTIRAELLESCLNNSLKVLLLNLKKQDRELEESYTEMRDHFYNYCLILLENNNKKETHFFILQLILKNLLYTNNYALKKFGFEFPLTTNQLELLYNSLNQHLFIDLQKSHKPINKRRTTSRIDSFPNLSLEQMELFNKCVRLIGQCPSILITPQLGLMITRHLLNLARTHEYFKNLSTPIASAITQSLLKILQQDSETKRNTFWVLIKKYAEIFYVSDTEDEFDDFVQTCFSAYFATVNKLNQTEKKNDFMSNCAEMIVFGFKELKFIYLFGLLSHIFQRPQKLLKVLEIDKQVYQKFCAFYDSKSNEYYQSDRPEQEKKEVEKTERILKNKLKQMSGLTFKVLEKIQEQRKSASRQASYQKETKNQDAIKMNKLEDEDEEEIPFTKQMKK